MADPVLANNQTLLRPPLCVDLNLDCVCDGNDIGSSSASVHYRHGHNGSARLAGWRSHMAMAWSTAMTFGSFIISTHWFLQCARMEMANERGRALLSATQL